MKETKTKLVKYWTFTRRTIGWLLIGILAFSGFLRFVELNTTCSDFNSYYEFQDTYCTYSGLLNHKIECELPSGVPIKCTCDLGLFKFPVVKSDGTGKYTDYVNQKDEYSFNFTNFNQK